MWIQEPMEVPWPVCMFDSVLLAVEMSLERISLQDIAK